MDKVGYSCNIDTPYIQHNQDKKNRENKSVQYNKLDKELEKWKKEQELIEQGKLDKHKLEIDFKKYYVSKTTGEPIRPKGSKIDRTKAEQNVYLKVPRIQQSR